MLRIERETGGFATMRASMDGSLIFELLLGDGRKPGCILDRSLITGGKLRWASRTTDLLIYGQGTSAINQARLMLGEERVTRIDSVVPDGLLSLDRYAPNELISRASRDSQHVTPVIAKNFIPHVAATFVPCHATEGGVQ